MNDARRRNFLKNGGKIQQLASPGYVPRDLNVCLNCKNLFPVAEMTKGSQRRCKKCHARHTKFKGIR